LQQVNNVLVASDRRLLRAARAEGLAAIDPEQSGPDEVAVLREAW
jgi:hypothetical protein